MTIVVVSCRELLDGTFVIAGVVIDAKGRVIVRWRVADPGGVFAAARR